MANVLNANPMIIDSEGILSTKPLCIKMVRFFRNAYDDAATFTYWIESDTPDHHLQQKTSTWATLTHTSTGNNPAGSPAENDIVYFYYTSTGNNQFRMQCATAGDDNDAVYDALNSYFGSVSNETNKTYNWKIWTPKTAFSFKAGVDVDAEQGTDTINFGDKGMWFQNLAMNGLSTSATAEIYLK